MGTGQEPAQRYWNIPNMPRDLSLLETYAFPSTTQPAILMASTRFPHRNTTRDAFLVALQERNTDLEEPIRVAFEFNIARKSGQNKNNIRLEGGKEEPITIRCRGSFNLDGFRLKSADFFEFLDRKKLVQDAPGLTVEQPGRRRFAKLIELDGPDVSGCWPELVKRLSWFAWMVWAFKTTTFKVM